MKKLIIAILFIACSVGVFAQKPFVVMGHVPRGYFTNPSVDRDIRANGVFLWSFDAVVGGAEINYNPETTSFETSVLSGVGGAIGYKHYKALEDGTALSNWGVNLALLTKVQVNAEVTTKMKVALLVNFYNLTVGPVYTFGNKFPGLLVGANIQF